MTSEPLTANSGKTEVMARTPAGLELEGFGGITSSSQADKERAKKAKPRINCFFIRLLFKGLFLIWWNKIRQNTHPQANNYVPMIGRFVTTETGKKERIVRSSNFVTNAGNPVTRDKILAQQTQEYPGKLCFKKNFLSNFFSNFFYWGSYYYPKKMTPLHLMKKEKGKVKGLQMCGLIWRSVKKAKKIPVKADRKILNKIGDHSWG